MLFAPELRLRTSHARVSPERRDLQARRPSYQGELPPITYALPVSQPDRPPYANVLFCDTHPGGSHLQGKTSELRNFGPG